MLKVKAVNDFNESSGIDVNITLITTPHISDYSKSVYDNTLGGTKIGNLHTIKNANIIKSITLSGIGSDDFEVDLDGVIHVAQGVTL